MILYIYFKKKLYFLQDQPEIDVFYYNLAITSSKLIVYNMLSWNKKYCIINVIYINVDIMYSCSISGEMFFERISQYLVYYKRIDMRLIIKYSQSEILK